MGIKLEDEKKYLVWLSSIDTLSVKKVNQLLAFFGNAKNIFEADEVTLQGIRFLTDTERQKIRNKEQKKQIEGWMEKLHKEKIKIVTPQEEHYPRLLKNIVDPPYLLYYKGTLQEKEPTLGVVGSRRSTTYGEQMTQLITKRLGELGFVVVSGLARGIDSIAHATCVKNEKRTIAVLGCGVDVAYPPENKRLMDEIIEKGAIISEFMPGVGPKPYHFPRRNRVISGISYGVIIIEAGEKSGSLITANFALEQGREVFALPGSLLNRKSVGTNRLIKDGAKMVTSIEDILEELQWMDASMQKKGIELATKIPDWKNMGKTEKKILEKLVHEPMHQDELARATNIPISELQASLLYLELNGYVKQMQGKMLALVIDPL